MKAAAAGCNLTIRSYCERSTRPITFITPNAPERSPHYKMHSSLDAGVGFGFFQGRREDAPSRADNLGTDHVFGIWAYQGSKPFLSRGRMFSGMGDTIPCVDPETKELLEKAFPRRCPKEELLDTMLTPARSGQWQGFLRHHRRPRSASNAENGETLWSVEIGEPVIFQPAVAGGRVYVTTASGSLFAEIW